MGLMKTNGMFPEFVFGVPAGLIESLVEWLKQIHSQLNLQSVRPGKALHRKKVRSRNWTELPTHVAVGGCSLVFSTINLSPAWKDKYYVFCLPSHFHAVKMNCVFKHAPLCLSALSGRRVYERGQADGGDSAECSLLQRWLQSEFHWTPFNSPLLIFP